MNIIANYPVNYSYPSTVGGTGTATKYFPYVPGGSIGAVRTTPSSSSSIGQLKVPGNGRLDGQLFEIDVVGSVAVDSSIACPTLVISLFAQTQNSAPLVGNNPLYTAIAKTGSVAAHESLSNEPFRLKASVSVDSRTGVLQGIQTVLFANNLENSTPKVLENTLTGINMQADVPFGLVVGISFSVSGANNAAYLTQFSISE